MSARCAKSLYTASQRAAMRASYDGGMTRDKKSGSVHDGATMCFSGISYLPESATRRDQLAAALQEALQRPFVGGAGKLVVWSRLVWPLPVEQDIDIIQ